MPNRQSSPRIVTMVAIAQGLLTLALLLVGLGLGFSIPEPIPPFLLLAVLSGAALAGIIARQYTVTMHFQLAFMHQDLSPYRVMSPIRETPCVSMPY